MASTFVQPDSTQHLTHSTSTRTTNATQSTSYSLTAVLAELDPKTVAQVKDCDERIRRKRKGACVRMAVCCVLLAACHDECGS